jgi:Tol biopolymer transport system component
LTAAAPPIFTLGANNLVGNDSNGWNDVFVRDMQTGQTTRVSLHSNGAQATGGNSSSAAIAADGRYVAFTSAARNLVDGDTNTCPTFPAAGACPDIFVHDRQTGETTRVSVGPGGAQANGASYDPAISADGRYVAFQSSASNLVDGDTNTCPNYQTAGACPDIFVHDRQTGETTRVSVGPGGAQANRDSYSPAISADGRYVAFQSSASNLVSGDTNTCQGSPVGACPDIFIHDRQTGLTTRASVSSAGAEANNSSGTLAMAANGAYIAFESTATNLVSGADTNDNADIFVRYMSAPRDVELVSQPTIYLPLVRRP